MKKYTVFQLISILTPFVFSFALGLDIYIPIVPEMSQIFNASPALVQMTLSLFLFMTGFGQLLIGPLSDQWGRKRIFYIASLTFAAGSLGCAFSQHIYELIFARFICSIGACGMLVTSFAVIRDLYSSDDSAKMYSFLNGAVGISPTFAPIVGGYLAVYFGWQSIFYFLTLVGACAFLITHRCVHETLEPAKRTKIDRAVFKRFWDIFTHRQFLCFALIAGVAEGIFFCFFSLAPFIIINTLGVPTHIFGFYFALFGLVIGLGGFGSGKLIEKYGINATLSLGFLLMISGGVSMLAWHQVTGLSLAGFLIPMALACTGAMFVAGGSASCALEPFGNIAGTASAAFGATQFSASSIAGTIVMLFSVETTVPYGTMIVLMTLSCLGLFHMRPKRAETAAQQEALLE